MPVSVAFADFEDSYTPASLARTFLQLLAIVIGGRFLVCVRNLLDAAFDGLLAAGAINDGGLVVVDGDALLRA